MCVTTHFNGISQRGFHRPQLHFHKSPLAPEPEQECPEDQVETQPAHDLCPGTAVLADTGKIESPDNMQDSCHVERIGEDGVLPHGIENLRPPTKLEHVDDDMEEAQHRERVGRRDEDERRRGEVLDHGIAEVTREQPAKQTAPSE